MFSFILFFIFFIFLFLMNRKNFTNFRHYLKTPWNDLKSKHSRRIFLQIPSRIVNYYEPFLGSGTVLLNVLRQQKAGNIIILKKIFASDSNKSLIQFFKALQNYTCCISFIVRSFFVIPFINLLRWDDKESFYCSVQSDFNLNIDCPSPFQVGRLLFLSFLGTFCLTSDGLFIGSFNCYNKQASIFKITNAIMSKLVEIGKLLENVIFSCEKFDLTMNLQKGDFIFLDPSCSFFETSKLTRDESYSSLFCFCDRANQNGAFFLLNVESCPDTEFFAKNYHTIRFTRFGKGVLLISNFHQTAKKKA